MHIKEILKVGQMLIGNALSSINFYHEGSCNDIITVVWPRDENYVAVHIKWADGTSRDFKYSGETTIRDEIMQVAGDSEWEMNAYDKEAFKHFHADIYRQFEKFLPIEDWLPRLTRSGFVLPKDHPELYD